MAEQPVGPDITRIPVHIREAVLYMVLMEAALQQALTTHIQADTPEPVQGRARMAIGELRSLVEGIKQFRRDILAAAAVAFTGRVRRPERRRLAAAVIVVAVGQLGRPTAICMPARTATFTKTPATVGTSMKTEAGIQLIRRSRIERRRSPGRRLIPLGQRAPIAPRWTVRPSTA